MLSPRVQRVCPMDGHTLRLWFEDGTERLFDVAPYLERGIFNALRDEATFRAVRVAYGGVEWPGGQSLSPDTLYLRSEPVAPHERLGEATQP